MLLVFRLDEQRYALHLAAVERVVRAAQITPLPKAPSIVLGAINVQGRIIPVVDVRRRFGFPERNMRPGDSLILARTDKRAVALSADVVDGLLERSEDDVVAGAAVVPKVPYLDGVAKLDDGLVLIHNLSSFLSLDEEEELAAALPTSALRLE